MRVPRIFLVENNLGFKYEEIVPCQTIKEGIDFLLKTMEYPCKSIECIGIADMFKY